MKVNVALILEDIRMNMYSISASIERIESAIFVTRQQLNHHLDKLQDNFVAEAVKNSTKQIQSFIMALTKKQREIEEWIEDVESIKKHATDRQTFLGMTNLETKLNKTSNDLQSWIDGNHLSQTVVSFHLNTLLHNIINERTKF
ncbi:Hypothetical predicted protein [Mytilus galloprovincialis]|uniref:Uncharacterized protein n=1 Tax=Mytilus galloprovincialis TaxID=29158 RepID=A0A8B6FRD9_MYTGA|nr:Hypothetical predicted protein [Mytilus galloprovincialis]